MATTDRCNHTRYGVRRCMTRGVTIALAALTTTTAAAECVVLLHGLARSASAMAPLAEALAESGYTVANIDYPSRTKPIEALAPIAVERGLEGCGQTQPVHFVTHSLGGILVRYYLEQQPIDALGRVVMLAPPNQGSEVVDAYRDLPGYQTLNGPAGLQLGTDATSVPLALGPVTFDLGVIAGNKTFNPILSLSLPDPDDGKVSVESTKVEGMRDFIEMPHTHTFIMRAAAVIEQVKHYLTHGRFAHTRGDTDRQQTNQNRT